MAVAFPKIARYQALVLAAARDILNVEGQLRLVVISDSMRPLLRRNDWVIVRPVSDTAIRKGEIVVFEAGGSLNSHRVISIGHDTIRTKGDALLGEDLPVNKNQVFGVIESIERDKRKLNLNSPIWRLVSGLVANVGVLEAHTWQFFHLRQLPVSFRKPLDMINWLVRLPLRTATWMVVTFALWID